MNKSELIDSIAAASGLTKTDSVKALNVRNEKMNVVYFRFSTDDEAINFFKTFDLKVMRYIKHKISSVHLTPFNLLPYLDDYTHPWTDKDLYDFFELTPEEKELKEKELKWLYRLLYSRWEPLAAVKRTNSCRITRSSLQRTSPK